MSATTIASEAKQVAEGKAAIDNDPLLSKRNILAIATMPMIKNSFGGGYFPEDFMTDEKDWEADQHEARNWMFARALRGESYEETVRKGIIHRTMNPQSDTFVKDATLLEKYYILRANHPEMDSTMLGKLTKSMIVQNMLMPAAESELFKTHYYEQMFRGFAYTFKARQLIRGIITSKSATVRLPKHNEISVSYTTWNKWSTVRPGAEINEDQSTYTYVEATPVKHSFISALPDEFEQDSEYPISDTEMWRFGQKLGYLENYDLEYGLIANANATATDLADAKMTVAKLGAGGGALANRGYEPRRCLMTATTYWTGLLAQTGIYDYAYGSSDPMQAGLVPRLYGIALDNEVASAGYMGDTTDTTYSAILTDPDYSYVFVQRYAPFMERAREIRTQVNLASLTHKYHIALLYSNAIQKFLC